MDQHGFQNEPTTLVVLILLERKIQRQKSAQVIFQKYFRQFIKNQKLMKLWL